MLNVLWGLPFLGLLVSIAVLPATLPRFWERQMGFVALGWCLALLVPLAFLEGPGAGWKTAWHAVLIEYFPFVTLLAALYTASGGVLLRGGPAGTPMGNVLTVGLGIVLGSVIGTTGAAMVTIHPLLYANAHRRRKVHLALFAIVLVGNAGGALTPLGNPPLYIGLLRGVPFLWPAVHLALPFLLVNGVLLATFWIVDHHLARTEPPPPPRRRFRVRGWPNIGLLGLVVLAVLLQATYHPGDIDLLGQPIGAERLLGGMICFFVVSASLWITPLAIREANDFHWHPMLEVGVLFAGIFITIGPVLDMLHAGLNGPLAPVLRLAMDSSGQPSPIACFWLAGVLSAFLDNAPTYLVFFDLAGINPASLTEHSTKVLTAISAGAVFFGGLTYIGNAPNLMLRSVAAHRGVRMPGFFGFLFMAAGLLLPVFVLMSVLFFM